MQQQSGVKTAFVQNRYQHIVGVLGLDFRTDEKHLRRPEKEFHHVGQFFLLIALQKDGGWMQRSQCGVRLFTGHWHLVVLIRGLEIAAEMVAGDEEFFVVTQAVHRAALWRHIGIQVDFGATEFARFGGDGIH